MVLFQPAKKNSEFEPRNLFNSGYAYAISKPCTVLAEAFSHGDGPMSLLACTGVRDVNGSKVLNLRRY